MFPQYQPNFQPFYFYPFSPQMMYFNQQFCDLPLKKQNTIVLSQVDLDKSEQIETIGSSIKKEQQQFPVRVEKDIQKPQKNKKITKQISKISKPHNPKKCQSASNHKRLYMSQKQGRNSHSNILRKFFKLLSVDKELKQTIEKIIYKKGFKISIDQFYSQIRYKQIDHRNYIRVKQVNWIYENENSEIQKLMRILLHNYLQNYYIQHLLSSKKTDRKSIAFHLQGRRTLQNEISGKLMPLQSQSQKMGEGQFSQQQ